MTIDIGKLKSARVITDPAEAARCLLDAHAKSAPASGVRPHTHVEATDSGVRVVKMSGLSILPTKAKLPDADTIRQMAESRGIEWRDGMESRVIPYWASDARPDMHGDIVLQNWVFDEYQVNPVIALQHEWDQSPVGKGIDWGVRRKIEKGYDGESLYLLALFAMAEDSERADSAFRLVKSGFMTASSVGFFSDRVIYVEDDEERAQLGLGRWGYILDGNHLLEMSPVTIPANIGAGVMTSMAKAKSLGVKAVDIEFAREIARLSAKSFGRTDDQWRADDAVYLEAARCLYPKAAFRKAEGVDDPITDDEPKGDPKDPKGDPKSADQEPTIGDLKSQLDILSGQLEDVSALMSETILSMNQKLDDVREISERIDTRTESFSAGIVTHEPEGAHPGADEIDPIMAAAMAVVSRRQKAT